MNPAGRAQKQAYARASGAAGAANKKAQNVNMELPMDAAAANVAMTAEKVEAAMSSLETVEERSSNPIDAEARSAEIASETIAKMLM